MSLEQALAENTAAVKELIGISKELLAVRTEALEKVGTAAVSTTKKADKPAADAKKTEDKPQISTSPENRTENPYEGIKELIAEYIGGTDREEERAARKEKVKALLNHEKIKKPDLPADARPDASNIKEDAIDLFKDQIGKLKAKGDITEPPKKASDDLDL